MPRVLLSLRILLLAHLAGAIGTAPAAAAPWRAAIDPVLKQHCVVCHEGASAEGELDLTTLSVDLSDAEAMRRWVRVFDRVTSGEMPPEDEPRLSDETKTKLTATLHHALHAAHRTESSVVLRRLNRTEYENTVRDLFDTHVRVKSILPEDTPTAGFDNVGSGLSVSVEAMKAYLDAADAAIDAAVGPAKEPQRVSIKTNLLDQKDWKGRPLLTKRLGHMFRKTDAGMVIFQSNYCPTAIHAFKAPAAGSYRVTIRARAIQSEDPVVLRVYGGDVIVNRFERHVAGYFDIPPNEWITVDFVDRLVEPRGTFLPKCYNTYDTRKNADTFPGPGIELGEITIEGPLEAWPPPSRKKLLGEVDLAKGTADDARAILARFLPRAFRRSVEPAEIEPYAAMVQAALDQGRSFEAALRLGLKAVLCSPEFLFLEEPGRETINDYALASRLSYFLWSSMPDETLLRLASESKLGQADVLRQQVERMLADPKSDAFVENFTGQWLDLREIDFTSPDPTLFPEFDELLKISMVRETHAFFRELLDNDLSLMNFVDSDFAMLNHRLARHYGIEGVVGQEIRKVQLPEDSVRGGVLTQASVLKVSANGTNTSPVLRGVWVLDNILGYTVPPPPSNVGSVEPDTRGATTIREQLAKHRHIASCAACHKDIDPPGFALENFNPIGGWRTRYRTLGEGDNPGVVLNPYASVSARYRLGLPVDASGNTPDGTEFSDIREFKKILLKNPKAVAAGPTRKLLTYALGRQIGFSDRPTVERLVDKIATKDFGLRTLVHEIVQSKEFRQP